MFIWGAGWPWAASLLLTRANVQHIADDCSIDFRGCVDHSLLHSRLHLCVRHRSTM